jgi:hypothetical protein
MYCLVTQICTAREVKPPGSVHTIPSPLLKTAYAGYKEAKQALAVRESHQAQKCRYWGYCSGEHWSWDGGNIGATSTTSAMSFNKKLVRPVDNSRGSGHKWIWI